MARLIALILGTNALLLGCALLFAIDQREAGLAVGGTALIGFMGGSVLLAGSIPHDRIRSADENVSIGLPVVIAGGVILLLGAAFFGYGAEGFVPGTVLAVTGANLVMLGAGALNAAMMLRALGTVIPGSEEPLALALAANGMPGRSRQLVAAMADRIIWAEGRGVRERHSMALADVDHFDIDYPTGRLVVSGVGQELRVKPVPKRELRKFERLLSRAR